MATPNEDSIGHTPAWYRRELSKAQDEIHRLRNALTLAQAEITTLRSQLSEERQVNFIAAEMEAERQGLVMS